MPNASTTQASSASETTGTPIPLAYGYVWATGKRHAYYMLQQTGDWGLDYTRVGFWLLGHGEWDGPVSLWINDKLAWEGVSIPDPRPQGYGWHGWDWITALDSQQDIVFHFHRGCDSVIGSGLAPQSNGPDQQCDRLWSVFPPAVQPLCFSRVAYYGLMRKQPILWQQHNGQEDPSQWTDINPIGLWRALRCRLFDGDGNVTGYAFTRNPVWHWVDVKLRRELFPEYSLPFGVGPDPLPAAVSARLNWGKIYDSAQYCNQILSSGQPRFTGDYVFSQQTSLQAVVTKILRACRGFEQESQGQLAVVVDQPRPSVFTFNVEHILPGSWSASDSALSTAGNRILGQFRDVLVPTCSTIESISNPGQGDPEVTTTAPHPFMQGDRIAIGGTGTTYDGEATVSSVPAIINPGSSDEVDPTTFTIARKGWNYPTAVGAGGACGLVYSRFKERTPEFWHKENMLARGAYALNLARQRNRVKDALDFDTSTYDQVSRICRYERDRNLGFDQAPYKAPARVRLAVSLFARDVNGALACGIETGDRVTLDDTVRFPYAGDYEVVDPLVKKPPQSGISEARGTMIRVPEPESGAIELSLQTYDEGYMYDTSDTLAAGWPSVPGSFPGNDAAFSSVPLANGGNFVFFTGQLPNGSQFQLPSTGYPSGNVIAWGSPAGANVQYHSACYVRLCGADPERVLALAYQDGAGNEWGGDVNYACLTWLSPDQVTVDGNGMTWLALTLLGGEEILFGHGILANGSTVVLPAGWSTAQAFANAFIHDQAATADIMYLCGAWVDAAFGVHCATQDHVGNTTYGNASVLVFAWNNNMGTVVSQTLGPATWLTFPLSDGSKFGVGIAKNMADGSTLLLPASANGGITLEPIAGPSDNFYTSAGGHAQGVGSCYLDQNETVHCTFNDGSGDTWASTADVFATFAIAAGAPLVIVRVSPAAAQVAAGALQAFVAVVDGGSSQAVTWSVDGVLMGNLTTGTIDVGGNYAAPNVPGTHTVTATSVSNPGISASVTVIVTGLSLASGSVLTDGTGSPILIGNAIVYLE
jgi:hypothetical protein